MAGTASIKYEDVNNKDGHCVSASLPGATAATAGNYGVTIFTNVTSSAIEVLRVTCDFTTKSSSGGATLAVLNRVGAAAGNSMLATAFDLTAANDTVQTREGRTLNSYRVLQQGDRISLSAPGGVTALAGLGVSIYYKYVGKGGYN